MTTEHAAHTPGTFDELILSGAGIGELLDAARKLEADRTALLAALEHVMPWLNKAIADDAFRNTVGPSVAVKVAAHARAALAQARGAAPT